MLTYSYPASRMPLDTIASAVCSTRAAETSQWKLFQLFHPMGGVGARSPRGCCEADRVAAGAAAAAGPAKTMPVPTARPKAITAAPKFVGIRRGIHNSSLLKGVTRGPTQESKQHSVTCQLLVVLDRSR